MERSPHDTDHTFDSGWPLTLGVDERGRSIHVCADCGAEIPDGVLVERDEQGRVLAFVGSLDPAGERTVIHHCGTEATSGG